MEIVDEEEEEDEKKERKAGREKDVWKGWTHFERRRE